jgi:DNA-binding response OmpR family regulator
MRILIVEDDKKVGPFITRELDGANYSTTLVTSCAAAHDALAEGTYDVIVLDMGCACCGNGVHMDSMNRY